MDVSECDLRNIPPSKQFNQNQIVWPLWVCDIMTTVLQAVMQRLWQLELWVKSQRISPSHTNNYLLWSIFLDIFVPNNLPSCTSSGCIILLWKVSSILVHPFRRSCAHKTYGQTDRVISYTPHPNQRLCFQGGIKTQHLLDLSYYYYVPEVWYLRNGLCLQSTLSVQAGVRLLSLVS